jgi:hypothetical protein
LSFSFSSLIFCLFPIFIHCRYLWMSGQRSDALSNLHVPQFDCIVEGSAGGRGRCVYVRRVTASRARDIFSETSIGFRQHLLVSRGPFYCLEISFSFRESLVFSPHTARSVSH